MPPHPSSETTSRSSSPSTGRSFPRRTTLSVRQTCLSRTTDRPKSSSATRSSPTRRTERAGRPASRNQVPFRLGRERNPPHGAQQRVVVCHHGHHRRPDGFRLIQSIRCQVANTRVWFLDFWCAFRYHVKYLIQYSKESANEYHTCPGDQATRHCRRG
jgi:hypothetical protein